jgi:antitoxin component of MazEF toxin-antitoxin module
MYSTGKNSNAIIIPLKLLKKYNLQSSDYIILEEKVDGIFLKKLTLQE